MVDVGGDDSETGVFCHPLLDWPEQCARATGALRRRLRREGMLTPREVAETVTGALPAALGQWLSAKLASLGWLSSQARVPFDILDSQQCPAGLDGPVREVARLAIFGLPGEGRPDFKHRDAIYQQICALVMRDASNPGALANAATRALSHPDVCQDPVLAGMVRAFIAEREAALRTMRRVEHPEPEDESQLRKPFEEARWSEFPTRQQVRGAFLKCRHDFEVHLAQYNEAAARYALEKLQEMARRFPVHIEKDAVRSHEQQFEEFVQRCNQFRRQIEDGARQAAQAARAGDQKTATWLIRRLRAIHALTPVLLSAERFEALREEIEQSSEEHEHREALREMIARERDVAAEIKKAGAAIYRFHKVARTLSPRTDDYKRAEAAYREAVDEVRKLDTEWLTGLLLELETYFEDLQDPTDRAQEQLDRFINTVRSALNQLRLEIRAIQAERTGGAKPAPTARPTDGDAATPPAL